MRKSPIKHTVHTYKKRTGKVVQNYLRGEGEHITNISKPRLHKSYQQLSKFIVHINYAGQSPEVFPINASTYPEAIRMAMIARFSIAPPTLVEATKPQEMK